MRLIGLLGGTFDPIHYGHLKPALQACELLAMDEIRILPNHIPPHKMGTHASLGHRLAMLRLAIAEHPEFILDLRETRRDKPSYTVDTLAELREENPHAALCFIMGTDSFLSLDSWHRWQELLPLANIVVTQRPGEAFPQQGTMGRYFQQHVRTPQQLSQAGGIFRLQTDMLDISSTLIREAIGADSGRWQQQMPPAVAGYIQQHRLYKAIKSE